MRLAFELVVAQTERLPRPEQGPATEQTDTHPVVWCGRIEGIRNLLLIHPDVCVELAGLEDVLEPPRWFEAAIGKLVCWLALGISGYVCHGACVQHQAVDALLGQDLRSHSTGMARPDNQHVVGCLCHYLCGESLTSNVDRKVWYVGL